MIKVESKNLSYSNLEKYIDQHKNVLLYVYNDDIYDLIKDKIENNINQIKSIYNIEKTIIINKNENQNLEKIFKNNLKVPMLIVFENKEMVEFLEDIIILDN